MINYKYAKPEKIALKDHPELNEKWIQEIIADDPSVLGLGDLILKDKERIQPRAGRLDLLLQDSDSTRRYEVEIQLGKTDESHIIRTIEYWDIERKRYPQYEHCAVIVAEDITGRFLNVISLFNGFIPLVAIQANALKVGDYTSLVFTTVLDQMTLGLVDEDEKITEVTDRAYWLKRANKTTITLVDDLLSVVKEIDTAFDLNYTKHYIGLIRYERVNNFITFHPRKKYVALELRIPKDPSTEDKIEEAGLNFMRYDKYGVTKINLAKKDIQEQQELLTELIKIAYDINIS